MSAPGFLVEVDRFPELGRSLTDGATTLDAVAVTLPDPPDAGASTAVVADALAGVSEAVGLLVVGMHATSGATGAAGEEYRSTDDDAAHGLPGHPI